MARVKMAPRGCSGGGRASYAAGPGESRLCSRRPAAELLRNQAGKQTLLRVKPQGKTDTTDFIVKPISSEQERGLRYHEWEFTRRLKVDEFSPQVAE